MRFLKGLVPVATEARQLIFLGKNGGRKSGKSPTCQTIENLPVPWYTSARGHRAQLARIVNGVGLLLLRALKCF